jgi:nucleoside-diphosphate-sugar epimerase
MDPNKRPDFIGNRNLIDAARTQGIARFVLVTVIGAGDSAAAVPPGARRGHSTVIPLKTQAEDYLRASGLQFTIVRPGGLGLQPADTTAVLVEDPKAFSFLARSDLGRLTADALGDPASIGKTYTAYDPERRMLWKLFTN